MTFRDYWNGLVTKNDGLIDTSTKMTISVESFKKQLEKAYLQGSKDKAAVAHDFKKNKDDNFESLFGNLFK